MCRTAFFIASISVAASLLLPAAGAAQCRLCSATPGISGAEEAGIPVEIEVESTLRFDRLVQSGAGTGTATLAPDGTKAVAGSLGHFAGAGLVGSAVIRGEPGRLLRIDMPALVELYSLSGARAVVDKIVTDLPAAPRLDSAGRLSFHFGGRLQVSGEGEGDYRGDLPITAEYL